MMYAFIMKISKNVLKHLKSRKILIIIALLLAGFGYFIYQNYQKSNSTNKVIQTRSSTAKVQKGLVQSSVSASGTVQTANYFPITTSVNGIVKSVLVKEGDIVKKGQKIMEITLDSEGENSKTSAYAAYLRAKISLDSAKNSLLTVESTMIQEEQDFENEKRHNTYQSDSERQSFKIAENSYLQAKANYEIKKAEIPSLQLSVTSAWLEYQSQSPTITAPEAGTISNIVAVQGNKIENSLSEKSVQTVASIKLEGTPIVSVNVTEVDINSIKVGQKALISLNSIQGVVFDGTVLGIDKIGTVSSGVPNYPVIVKLDKESDKILPNMTVEAEIIKDQISDVLYIPTSALNKGKEKSFVFVNKNGTRNRIEVVAGLTGGKFVEIKEGLNEGDEIVINALPTVGFTTGTGTNTIRGIGIPGLGGGR